MKNDRQAKKILSDALFSQGQNKRKDGKKKYEEAINYFKDAIEVNNHLYIAKKYIAESYFELKKY